MSRPDVWPTFSLSSSLFDPFQPLSVIATTPDAVARLAPLCLSLKATLWVPEALLNRYPVSEPLVTVPQPMTGQPLTQLQAAGLLIAYQQPLQTHLESLWAQQRALIFALAAGAVVRLIAPLLGSKAIDPAVVVVDPAGQVVISLCGGHQAGADQLTRQLAVFIGATAVLTGAASSRGQMAVDLLGQPFGWQRGPGDWTALSAAVAAAQPIAVIQQAGSRLWQSHLPAGHPFQFADSEASNFEPAGQIWISPWQDCATAANPAIPNLQIPTVQWYPRVLWLGIGCERGTSQQLLTIAVEQVCAQFQLAVAAIAGVGTLDLKADEVGLMALCQERNWPLRCFTAEQLSQVAVPHPSSVVAAEVGTPSVAEAAALLAAGAVANPDCLPDYLPDYLLVSKQIIRHPGEPGAVTVAIAQAEREYTGRIGQLLLVGTGPGDLAQITPAAQTAIVRADAVIGYALYTQLLQPLFRPGQIIESLPITQERQRAQRAIELAEWGLTVAVVSSGDAGIYGMAGLVFEELQARSWNGKTPGVEVFPGVSALQSAAARVGSPLMHDFCAISLSDLLTPWEVIEQRLQAAAAADFVTALYNPRSQTRLEQLAQARNMFLAVRSPDTPVALVRSAYRPGEQIQLTRLGEPWVERVDMLTTVIIGNRSTRIYENWMITPRGYLGF